MLQKVHGLFSRDHARLPQYRRRRHPQPDVRRARAVGRAEGRRLLKIVRREVVVFRGAKFTKIVKTVVYGRKQQLTVTGGEGRGRRRGQSQRRRCRRGQQPHQPRRFSDHRRGEGHQQHAQRDRRPHRPHMGGEALAAAALGKGLPLQEPPVADEHAPEGREDRAEADPGLEGQQPQPHEAAHDGPAHAREQARVPPQALSAAAAGEPGARQRERQALQQGEQGGPGREGEARAPERKAEQDRGQGRRRQEAAQQAVEQAEAVHRGEGAAEDPGGVLPVAADPAVLALEPGQGRVGEGVGDGGVAQIAAAQQRALQRVVGEDAPLRQPPGAGEQELQVDQPLAREAAAVEGVHVQLPVQAAVGIAAAGSGEDEGEIGGGRALELGLDAGMEDAVAGGDRAVRAQARGVERMQGRGDQLARGAGHDAGIRVEGEDEARAREGGGVPGDGERRGLAREQAGQLQQRPALALSAAPGLAVKAALTRKEVKTAPVAAVELLHGPARAVEQRLVLRHVLPLRARQIGEQAEQQVLPLAAAQKAQLLQALGRAAAEQHGQHAQGLPLRRDARLGVETRQTPRRGELQQHEIGQALDQRPDRHQQEQGQPGIAQRKGQRERAEERQQDQGDDIQARAAIAARREQQEADVPVFPLRLVEKLPRELLFLDPAFFRQQREAVEIGAL